MSTVTATAISEAQRASELAEAATRFAAGIVRIEKERGK